MIRLDNINRKLQISLSSVVTTSQLSVNVSYSDKTPTDYIGSTQISTTNNTTSVDICTAPASSITRDIDFLSVYNADTVSATVNIIYNDNAITSILHKVTLNPTDKLVFVHGSGWQTIDSTGNLKTSGSTGATGPSGPAGLVGATGAGVVWMIEGEDGDIGPPGPRGVIGPQGITGSSMVAFSVPGMDGEDGDMGSPGPQGITGNTGIQGPQGNQGPIVMYDIPEPDEVFIVPGPTGIQGPQGGIGPAGPTGNSTVVQGFEGDDGENGDTGPPGPRGTTGITGPQGPQGIQGPIVLLQPDEPDEPLLTPGVQGSPGIQGNPGITGAQGPTGPAIFLLGDSEDEVMVVPGAQGPIGPQGPQGTGSGSGGGGTSILETVDWIDEPVSTPPGGPIPGYDMPTGGARNRVFYENEMVVTHNYTLTAGRNAMSVGPITVNGGITVTVPSGARWVVF